MRRIKSYLDPAGWRRLIDGQVELARRGRLDDRLDRILAQLGPVRVGEGEGTVVADGMWLNPNHFFRLRMFLEALGLGGESFRLLGILRRRSDWRARRALERIGFREFIHVEEDEEFSSQNFVDEAECLLASAETHRDLLEISLPHALPAYVWYDTVLKLAQHPQPGLDNPLWKKVLADTLRNLAIYERELGRRKVAHVALSHPWKSEWGSLIWLALQNAVPAYHLTGFCEAMRIRRFKSPEDYSTPVEHVSLDTYLGLPGQIRNRLAEIGQAALARRASGQSSDINVRFAYRPETRSGDREAARRMLADRPDRPLILVCGHVWYDFPHTFAMGNFTDFLDWIRFTLETIRTLDDAIWLLKPHPTEGWYGSFYLSEVADALPAHVRVLPIETDTASVLGAVDAVVTVHGSIGLEAVAKGVPAILADRSYYSGWGIASVARSANHYRDLLADAVRLPRPDAKARARAAACFALSLAEPSADVNALRMSCDSIGSRLYGEIAARLARDRALVQQESERICRFLSQTHVDSFAAFHMIETIKRATEIAPPIFAAGYKLRA